MQPKKLLSIVCCWALLGGAAFGQVSSTHLKAFWTLNETSSTRADSHGPTSLTDGNTVGSATGVAYANAAHFIRANSESLYAASNASIQLGSDSPFYVGAWFKLTTNPGSMVLINKGNVTGPGDDYLLWIDGTLKLQCYVGNGSGSGNRQNTAVLSLNTWYYGEMWYDPVADLLWLGLNRSELSAAWSGGTQSTAQGLALGARGSDHNANFLDGDLGAGCIFIGGFPNSTERNALYNSGAGATYATLFGGGGGGNGLVYPLIIGQLTRPTPWSRFVSLTPIMLEAR